MSKFGVGFFGFIVGAIAGGVTGYFIASKEKIGEIIPYNPKEKEEVKEESTPVKEEHHPDIKDTEVYKKIVGTNSYSNYYNDKIQKEVDEEANRVNNLTIESISPEAYGTKDGYDTMELSYYCPDDGSDEILADGNFKIVSDWDESTVGSDFMNHIGDYEPDAAYIRNNKTKTDYCIIECQQSYEEAYYGSKHV